jgi:hypothetical protein
VGIMTAAALPKMNSCLRIGVVSNGSSVPCSRSPTTVYAARVLGVTTGIKSRYRRGRTTYLSRLEPEVEPEMRQIVTTGSTRKSAGRMIMAATMDRLRR